MTLAFGYPHARTPHPGWGVGSNPPPASILAPKAARVACESRRLRHDSVPILPSAEESQP